MTEQEPMTREMPCDWENASVKAALRVADDAWEELRRSLLVRRQLGVPLVRVPHVSFSEAQRRSAVGRSLLRRIETIDDIALPHDLKLTMRLVRFKASAWSREAEWYWTLVDPLGLGFFALFLPTAYCGGLLLNIVNSELAGFGFTEPGDLDRYLALVVDYARLMDEFTDRTRGQAERGILMPKVQLKQAQVLLAALKGKVRETLSVAPDRLVATSATAFTRELESRIAGLIVPAFERALEGVTDRHLESAPESVGLGQYPGGAELYAELVKIHTTLNLTPEQVHAQGLKRMAGVERGMREIRTELGYGSETAFRAHLNQDPRWRANTAKGVAAVFQRYIDRLKPHLNQHFTTLPNASYRVAPLPEALQGSMTFGYYDEPRRDHAEGRYLFNSGNLTKQSLFNIAALTYHELMPGHHLHLATQQENKALHPFRAHSFVNAYNEGWAEYAATLAGEIGLYEEPEERYGRLVMDAFLTCRLVVDTGMNALGWSLERARDYMRAHSGMAEPEILTESVRYSCDIPGQSLAYKLGDMEILALREELRATLGDRFNLKEFHTAVLTPGALPLGDMKWHVRAMMAPSSLANATQR